MMHVLKLVHILLKRFKKIVIQGRGPDADRKWTLGLESPTIFHLCVQKRTAVQNTVEITFEQGNKVNGCV